MRPKTRCGRATDYLAVMPAIQNSSTGADFQAFSPGEALQCLCFVLNNGRTKSCVAQSEDATPSNRFRHHFNRPARALRLADSALADSSTLAVVQVELEALAWAQFDDGIVGADTVAVIALEAIAARQAAARLEQRGGGVAHTTGSHTQRGFSISHQRGYMILKDPGHP